MAEEKKKKVEDLETKKDPKGGGSHGDMSEVDMQGWAQFKKDSGSPGRGGQGGTS